jgi:NADPH:quinone reductase-like Zn-dependent oxidoreductase
MKAVVQDRFGTPEVLELREIDQPEAGDDEVLVRVRAASVNPADWYAMTGSPYVARPQMGLRTPKTRLGIDFAGVVEAVGGKVTRLRPGDEVFGAGTGALPSTWRSLRTRWCRSRATCRSSRPRPFPWPGSPPSRGFATRAGSSRGSRC